MYEILYKFILQQEDSIEEGASNLGPTDSIVEKVEEISQKVSFLFKFFS